MFSLRARRVPGQGSRAAGAGIAGRRRNGASDGRSGYAARPAIRFLGGWISRREAWGGLAGFGKHGADRDKTGTALAWRDKDCHVSHLRPSRTTAAGAASPSPLMGMAGRSRSRIAGLCDLQHKLSVNFVWQEDTTMELRCN